MKIRLWQKCKNSIKIIRVSRWGDNREDREVWFIPSRFRTAKSNRTEFPFQILPPRFFAQTIFRGALDRMP